MRRRDLIVSTGGLAAALLAGCLASGSDDPGEDDVTPAVVGHGIETKETDCMDEDGESVEVTFDADGVDIDGLATAPTPCHEATVESATVETGTLRVEVGLERADGMCIECVGAVDYAARIDLEGADGVDTVVVEHPDPGKTHTVERGGDGSGEDEPSPDDADGEIPSHEDAMEEPDPDLPITIENRHDEPHEVSVTVARASGETVYGATTEVAAGEERTVYNLEEAEPEGVEAFTVEAALGEQTESVEVETSACYGEVRIEVTEEGRLYPFYSIC